MRAIGILLAVLLGLSGQIPGTPTGSVRHLQYNFAYDTDLAGGGPGTGTMAVDILGRAADGGMLVSASDKWWNAIRPRESTQCEIYPSGGVSCLQAPYLLSPMQLVLFPLLARDYFSGVSVTGRSQWQQSYEVNKNNIWRWASVFDLTSNGSVDGRLVFVSSRGSSLQEGGHYRKGVADGYVVYDLREKIPVAVQDVRTHIPIDSVFSQDSVELQLTKDSFTKG